MMKCGFEYDSAPIVSAACAIAKLAYDQCRDSPTVCILIATPVPAACNRRGARRATVVKAWDPSVSHGETTDRDTMTAPTPSSLAPSPDRRRPLPPSSCPNASASDGRNSTTRSKRLPAYAGSRTRSTNSYEASAWPRGVVTARGSTSPPARRRAHLRRELHEKTIISLRLKGAAPEVDSPLISPQRPGAACGIGGNGAGVLRLAVSGRRAPDAPNGRSNPIGFTEQAESHDPEGGSFLASKGGSFLASVLGALGQGLLLPQGTIGLATTITLPSGSAK